MTPWTEADYMEYFNERAAIAEVDGGLTREDAEARARRETVELVFAHCAIMEAQCQPNH